MKYSIKTYTAVCATKEFIINGIEAYSADFGHQEDVDSWNAPDYCCGNMQFIPKSPTREILRKYKITEVEYEQIANELRDKLSWGSCSWCE